MLIKKEIIQNHGIHISKLKWSIILNDWWNIRKANPVHTDSRKIIHWETERDHFIRFLEKEINPKTLVYLVLKWTRFIESY